MMKTVEPPQSSRVGLVPRIQYAAMRVAMCGIGMLPESLTYRLVGLVGVVYFRFAKSRRRYALHMLQNAYPAETDDRKLLRLASRGTGNLLKVGLDMILVGKRIAAGRTSEAIDMSQLVDSGLRPPWIGVTPHLGSWEYGAIGVASLVPQAHATARTMKNPLARRYISESRRGVGLHVHDRRGGMRGVRRALVVGEQLQRHRGEDRRQVVGALRDVDDVVRDALELVLALGGHREHRTTLRALTSSMLLTFFSNTVSSGAMNTQGMSSFTSAMMPCFSSPLGWPDA